MEERVDKSGLCGTVSKALAKSKKTAQIDL